MGCCLSHSTGPNSPYPGGAPNASARHINPPPLTLPESVQSGTQHTLQAGSPRLFRPEPEPLNQHINRPLRLHVWTAKKRPWTRIQLEAEREEFFDTRVTGRPEIWQTLHATLRVLWATYTEESGGSTTVTEALATAQTILDAAEISLPTGDLANGAYDALGNYYHLPEWIVSDPNNVSDQNASDQESDSRTPNQRAGAHDDGSGLESAERRREEKGKEVDDATQKIKVVARLSENGKDFRVTIGNTDTVRTLVRKLAEKCSLSADKKIRVAYMGKMMKENLSLEAQGWTEGHIVNALVFSSQ